jgi:hypothetical protein
VGESPLSYRGKPRSLHKNSRRPAIHEGHSISEHSFVDDDTRDISEVPAVEVIQTVSIHLMTAAAVKLGLADDPDAAKQIDLDEARTLIEALAGLVTASASKIGDHHALALRDGLRTLQLAFREASAFPDAPGTGPGEKYTGPVN